MENEELLQRDLRLLSDILRDVIHRLAGPASVELVDEVRRLALLRRRGDTAAGAALADRVATLDYDQARVVARALSIFFDVANLAEEAEQPRGPLLDASKSRHSKIIAPSGCRAAAMMRGDEARQATPFASRAGIARH